VTGTTVSRVPIVERFQYFTAPGRRRMVLKTDLDQAQFLIGSAMEGSSVNINRELRRTGGPLAGQTQGQAGRAAKPVRAA